MTEPEKAPIPLPSFVSGVVEPFVAELTGKLKQAGQIRADSLGQRFFSCTVDIESNGPTPDLFGPAIQEALLSHPDLLQFGVKSIDWPSPTKFTVVLGTGKAHTAFESSLGYRVGEALRAGGFDDEVFTCGNYNVEVYSLDGSKKSRRPEGVSWGTYAGLKLTTLVCFEVASSQTLKDVWQFVRFLLNKAGVGVVGLVMLDTDSRAEPAVHSVHIKMWRKGSGSNMQGKGPQPVEVTGLDTELFYSTDEGPMPDQFLNIPRKYFAGNPESSSTAVVRVDLTLPCRRSIEALEEEHEEKKRVAAAKKEFQEAEQKSLEEHLKNRASGGAGGSDTAPTSRKTKAADAKDGDASDGRVSPPNNAYPPTRRGL